MGWSNVDVNCGFGGEGDETKKFGPRQEMGSSLYQVDTVASIFNEDPEGSSLPPWILSAGDKTKVAVVIESQIIIFDEGFSSKLCSFMAESRIDALCWSEDVGFLIYVDRSGHLSLAHVESQQILIRKKLVENHLKERRCFASVVLSQIDCDSYNLMVATSRGECFHFHGLDLVGLDKAVQEKDFEKAEEVQRKIKSHAFDAAECHNSIEYMGFFKEPETDQSSLLIVGTGDIALSKWLIDGDNIILGDICTHLAPNTGFKKCLCSPDGTFIIVLDTSNQISVWSRQSFCLLEVGEANVEDFNLYLTSSVETDTSNMSHSKEDLKIVLLSCPLDDGRRDLKVLSLPNFEHVYTLKVPSCAALASLPIEQEVIVYLVGGTEKGNDEDISNIQVKWLMEAIPQNRFSRLLHSNKFDEAEKFANTFKLDVQLVYKVKCHNILDQLSPWGSNSGTLSSASYENLLIQLKECLDKIEDMELIVNYCLKAQLPNLEATYQLLNYARERVRLHLETTKFTKSTDLFQELLDGINRLVTFETAFGAASFSGQTWVEFLSSSLVKEVVKCFKERKVNAGFIVWRRHQSELKTEFNIQVLQDILNAIPDDTPSAELIPWLKDDFVPYVLTVLPEGQCYLAHWLEKTAIQLEFSVKEKEKWPDNALDMAEVMYNAFSSVTQSTQQRDVATPMQFATKVCRLSIPYIDNTQEEDGGSEYGSAMKRLGNLVKSLREVKTLHHEYNCRLSLDQFAKESPKTIAFHLLDRIAAAELIHSTVHKFVKPYILKNGLKVDTILSEYVIEAVDSKKLGVHLWEQKVIAIVKEIYKKEEKCEAMLKLMDKAKTPWSSEMEKLISDEMKSNPGNQRLERQFQFANLRKMMKGYGIKNTNLADISKIHAVIRFMFKSDNANCLSDALEIAKASLSSESFIYSERIGYFIDQENVFDACELLKCIPKDNLRTMSSYVLNSIMCMIEWPPVDEEDEEDYIKKTHAAVLISSFAMKLDEGVRREIGDLHEALRKINCLQMEFGLFVSVQNYLDEESRKTAIQAFVEDPSKFTPKFCLQRKTKVASTESRLKRFSELLGFNEAALYNILIDWYKSENNMEKIFEIGCEVLASGVSVRNTRMNLLHKVVSILAFTDLSDTGLSWVKIANDLYSCATKALTWCCEDNLNDYLLLAKFMRIMTVIAGQCESTDFQVDSNQTGLLEDWIEDFYKDDSLALSPSDVYNYFQRMMSLAFPGRSDAPLKYQSNRLNGTGPFINTYTVEEDKAKYTIAMFEFVKVSQTLATLLQDSNHQELAMHIYMLGASMCSQRRGALQLGINVLPDEDPILMESHNLTEAELDFSNKIIGKAEKITTALCSSLVRSILSHRMVDHDLALCYMDVFDIHEGKAILSELQTKFKVKYSRIQNISKVGVDFAALRGDRQYRESCVAYKDCAAWGRKLQLWRVPQPWNIFKAYTDKIEKEKILQLLVAVKSVDLKAIISFCDLFDYDREKATFIYLEMCMLPQDSVGYADTSYQEKIDSCDLSVIQDQKQLEALFYGIAQKISSYEYEKLIYIFKKIAEITDDENARTVAEDNVQLLEMLAIYPRTGSDVSTSIYQMGDDLDDDQMFDGKTCSVHPDISKKRLPFHQLAKKAWDVLNPELTSENNVKLLKPIVMKLNFPFDQVCAKAVQLIGTKELEKIKQNQTENGVPVTFDWGAVENILNMISDDQMMIVASKWIVKNLPKGAEKVKALKGIINRANKLLECSSEELLPELKEMHKKFVDVYKRASCEAALMEFGITDKSYYALCNSRAALIVKLYEDYGDKMKFETGKLTGAPDIHSLAIRIVEISENIDLGRIQTHLMSQWLPWIRDRDGSVDDDEDVGMGMLASNSDDIRKKNEKNLRRVIYVLASSYNQNTIQTLLNAVYQETDCSSMTNVCQMRALQVLFTLVDSRSIEMESNMQIEEHQSKLVSCIYLAELESLHISHTLETFNVANKENLVKSLWRNHSHEPQGVRLIADLCLDYNIFDPQLWNSLLMKLLTFNLIPYLTHVLSQLSGIQQLREIPSLAKMWKAVITRPLSSVSVPLSVEEEKTCQRCAQLITRCPVILDIGLTDIAALMEKVGLYMQALFCLKLFPDKDVRKKSIQVLLDRVGVDSILSLVKKDRDEGIMNPHYDDVEREVYEYVEEGGLYLKLFGTPFFENMINYLIRTGKINKLLMKIISAGKFDYATSLLSKYLIENPGHEIAEISAVEGLDGANSLLRYLKCEGLLNDARPYITAFMKSKKDVGFNYSLLETTNNPLANSFSLSFM